MRLKLHQVIGLACAAGLLVGLALPWAGGNGLRLTGWTIAVHQPALCALPALGLLLAVLVYHDRAIRFQLTLNVAAVMLLCSAVASALYNDTAYLRWTRQQGLMQLCVVDGTLLRPLGGVETVGAGLLLTFAAALGGVFAMRLDRARFARRAEPVLKPGWARSAADLRADNPLATSYRWAIGGMLAGVVLIATYAWCGIDPARLWNHRGNAREYLFGHSLSAADFSYVAEQRDRAVEIEAQGKAHEQLGQKYRDLPWQQQPTLAEKEAEAGRIARHYMDGLSAEEKKGIEDVAYRDALTAKKGGYFPPETSWPKVRGYFIALLETLAIAIWGTLLAILFALPLAVFAAENTLKLLISGDRFHHRALRWLCVAVLRRFMDACRGFNELVMALIFIAVIGLGPFAGILALWIHSLGVLGKMFSEQIEMSDSGQIEALESTGATFLQAVAFAVLPQAMPGFVSHALLRFESNVRSAAILGFVGAGGIGFLINDKLNGYQYREVCTIMLTIIAAVGLIDYSCKQLRRQFT